MLSILVFTVVPLSFDFVMDFVVHGRDYNRVKIFRNDTKVTSAGTVSDRFVIFL